VAVFVPLHLRLYQHFHFKPVCSEFHNSAIEHFLGATKKYGFCTTVSLFGGGGEAAKQLKAE